MSIVFTPQNSQNIELISYANMTYLLIDNVQVFNFTNVLSILKEI